MVISTVTGVFESYNARIEAEGDGFENADAVFSADVDSVTTGVEQRDTHLKSDDFFNAEKYPKLTFSTTSIKKTGDKQYRIMGNMTIRDVTKEVELAAEHGGTIVDPQGITRAGFLLEGSLNRTDFGLKYNAVTEAGNIVVSDRIDLQLDVEMIKK
jgi:polyisoprenoid-binding protein YceI